MAVNVAEVERRSAGNMTVLGAEVEIITHTIGCKVTEVVPDKLISFEWRSQNSINILPITRSLTHVWSSSFRCAATDVHLIHSGWRSSAEWDEARQWQDRAWGGAFKDLEKQINQAGV